MMNYLSSLADKEVESVEPYVSDYNGQVCPNMASVIMTDGSKLTVMIDSREFYYDGEQVRTCDLDAVSTDRFFKHGVIRTPQPPGFQLPKDPILREIMLAFKKLRIELMGYYGSHHDNPEDEFRAIVRPWRETVQRYYGYRRGNSLTFEEGVFIQANERRPKWLLKLSNWLPTKVFATTSPR